MDFTCIVLLCIITFTNGRPSSEESSYLITSENELQNLLKTLYSQGKFDIAFTHHEDGPKIHHEDRARFFHHSDNDAHHAHHHYHQHEPFSHGHRDHLKGHQTHTEHHPSLTNIQTLNLFYRKKPESSKFSDNSDSSDSDIETLLGLGKKKKIGRSTDKSRSMEAVLDVLRDLDKVGEMDRLSALCDGDRCGVELDDNRDACIGDRCGRNEDDRADCQGDRCSIGRTSNNRDDDCVGDRCGRNNDRLACIGDRCGMNRDDNQRDDNCQGDRCDRQRLDDNDNDRDDCKGDRCGGHKNYNSRHSLRCSGDRCAIEDRACTGDRCGRDRDDDDRDDCVGDRCGRDRDDDDDKSNLRCSGNACSRNDRDDCVGDRCGRDRDHLDEDDDDNDNLLRCYGEACGRADCIGDRCGRDREDDDDRKALRCSGDNCGDMRIDRTYLRDRRLPDGDDHIKRQIQPYANKFKINDELDAIVVDISDLEKSLNKPHFKKRESNYHSPLQYIENVDLDNLGSETDGSDVDTFKSLNKKPIEAIVLDLSKLDNDLSREIRELSTDLKIPSKKQKRQKTPLYKTPLAKDRSESKILSHNEENNNVYVPKWLLEEVSSKTNLRDSSEQFLKNLLPLTTKQKQKLLKAISKHRNAPTKIFRRSVEDEIGVPFHLEIEGLGQINP